MESQELQPEVKGLLEDRFEIVEEIGRGSQGVTFRAVDRRSGQAVAVKELDLSQVASWKAIELFEREAQALESLDHPGVPDYIDTFHSPRTDGEGERFFLVQEFVDGEDLAVLIEGGLRMDEARARRFATELLELLVYLHERPSPVIHRDIKPSNILRRVDGNHVLIDFGAVQAILPGEKAGSTIVGTSGYMPLEQLMGRAVPATDLYALGATIVHLLTHRHPSELPVDGMDLQFEEFVNVSPPFMAFLKKMLASHVEDRFQSARDALAALRGPPAGAKPARPPAPVPAPVPAIDFGVQVQDEPEEDVWAAEMGHTRLPPHEVNTEVFEGPSSPPAKMRSEVTKSDEGLEVALPGESIMLVIMIILCFGVMPIGGLIGGYVASNGWIIFFSLLFLFLGPFVFKVVYVKVFGRITLNISDEFFEHRLSLHKKTELTRYSIDEVEGPVKLVTVVRRHRDDRGKTRTSEERKLVIETTRKCFEVGNNLPREELMYIAAELNDALTRSKKAGEVR
ncbi:MAG: serine/threonine protein kinase [Bradymonadaceae bacterium]